MPPRPNRSGRVMSVSPEPVLRRCGCFGNATLSPAAAFSGCSALRQLPYGPAMAIQIRTSLAEPETEQTFVPHRPPRPDKAEGGKAFRIMSDYEPAGDQPTAIKELTEAALTGEKD